MLYIINKPIIKRSTQKWVNENKAKDKQSLNVDKTIDENIYLHPAQMAVPTYRPQPFSSSNIERNYGASPPSPRVGRTYNRVCSSDSSSAVADIDSWLLRWTWASTSPDPPWHVCRPPRAWLSPCGRETVPDLQSSHIIDNRNWTSPVKRCTFRCRLLRAPYNPLCQPYRAPYRPRWSPPQDRDRISSRDHDRPAICSLVCNPCRRYPEDEDVPGRTPPRLRKIGHDLCRNLVHRPCCKCGILGRRRSWLSARDRARPSSRTRMRARRRIWNWSSAGCSSRSAPSIRPSASWYAFSPVSCTRTFYRWRALGKHRPHRNRPCPTPDTSGRSCTSPVAPPAISTEDI